MYFFIGLAVCHRIAAEGGNIAMVDWDSKRLSLALLMNFKSIIQT